MNTRRKDKSKAFSQHHKIDFQCIDSIAWHIEHLFNSPDGYEGWRTIETISQTKHKYNHKRKRKPLTKAEIGYYVTC